MSYSYFLASLPILLIRENPPLSSTEYVELLVGHLSPSEAGNLIESGLFDAHRASLEAVVEGGGGAAAAQRDAETAEVAPDAEQLSSIDKDSDEGVVVTELWKRFDMGLRGEIGRLRATSLKIDASPHWGRMDSFIYLEELRRIFQQVDPMERELQTHDLRWNFLDKLEQMSSNGLGGVVVYYLKLNMLERLQTMEHERAHQALSAIYDTCHTQFQEKIGRLSPQARAQEAETESRETASVSG